MFTDIKAQLYSEISTQKEILVLLSGLGGAPQPCLLRGIMVALSGALWVTVGRTRSGTKTWSVSSISLLGSWWAVSCDTQGTCGPCPSGWSGVTSRGRARGRCACGLEGRSWPCNKPTVLCQSKAFSYGLHPSSWGQEAAGHGRYSPSVPLTVWGTHAQPHSDIPPWEV